MTSRNRDHDYLLGLVRELCNLLHETDWVEFKTNYRDPHAIGESISALANAAALHGKAHAYMLWGIENGTLVITVRRPPRRRATSCLRRGYDGF